MKTQILRLDPHDDFISARDKMGWNQTGRILLVWPDHGRLLTRALDLTLVLRHSMKLGAQLALVTQDPDVIYHARQLSVPVYKSIPQAQKARWRYDRRKRNAIQAPSRQDGVRPDLGELYDAAYPQPSKNLALPGIRLGFFTLGVIGFLAIAAVLFPSASITLQPERRLQEAVIDVRSGPEIEKVTVSGAIPAYTAKVIVEGRRSTPSRGNIRVAQDYASGQVVFTNLTDSSVDVPEGSVVRTITEPAVRFATSRGGEVPAGPSKTLSLPIKALLPGEAANLPAGSLVAIEGQLGAYLSANNPTPTRGGKNAVMAIATDFDREQLLSQLESSLQLTAIEELQDQLPPGDILFTPTITISQVVDESYDPPEDTPSDQLSLSLQIEYQAQAVSEEDVLEMARAALEASLPGGFHPTDVEIEVEHLSTPEISSDLHARWKLRASRTIQAELSPARAVNLVLGQSPQAAVQRLSESMLLAELPEIRLSPSWWPRMPFMPFRIQFYSTPSS